MAFGKIDFFGQKLGKMSSFRVVLPEDGDGPFPVLYLLHGYSDNDSAWSRYTRIEQYLQKKKLIVVMPDGHVSYYINDPRPGCLAYEDHIVFDLVDFVDRTFNTIARRDGRALAGLSMGGHGAVLQTLKHPDRFCCASSHSGAVAAVKHSFKRKDLLEAYVAAGMDINEMDCFAQAEKISQMDAPPAIRFDCGTSDFLYQQNIDFDKHLEQLGVEHIFKEYPGQHDWEYWNEHVPESIDFALQHLATA